MMAHSLVHAWQRLLSPPDRAHRLPEARAAIHRYDPIAERLQWTRCRDRAQYHLGRARRAKDRGQYRDAAREIERALQYDDTRESYFQVLGQCYRNSTPPESARARWALERAFALNPRNGYTIRLLLELFQAEGDSEAARLLIQRALAAGAPTGAWGPALERLAATAPVA
jgi:tetratricopeptide (TPR) repeat protein